jgi:hypothetical protein
LKNKDLNAASKLQTYKTTVRPIVTYGCETWAMTATEQNHLLVFERRVLRKIHGPTQDKDGIWRMKTNEELEYVIKRKNIVRFLKSQRLRWVAHINRMDTTRTIKKTNRMGTMCIKTSRKSKIKVARSGRGGPAENESSKLETEEQRQEPVEQNREAGQNPPRVVEP